MARRKAERDAVSNSFVDVSSTITEQVLKDASIQTLEEAEITADYINVECSSAEEVQVNSNENCEEMEYVDKDELQPDKLVEDIFVYAVPLSDCRQPIPDAKEDEQEIRERFTCLGVEIRDIRIQTSKHGKYERGFLRISPINLNKIWGRRLGLKSCAVSEYKRQGKT